MTISIRIITEINTVRWKKTFEKHGNTGNNGKKLRVLENKQKEKIGWKKRSMKMVINTLAEGL